MNDDAAPDSDSSPHSAPSVPVATPAPLGGAAQALLGLLYLLPKNAISRMAGRFASLELPAALQMAEIKLFARLAGVNLSEARDPVSSFRSLQKFFTRALAEGRRKVEGDADTLVSPCDGTWGASGRIEHGTMLQVKGRTYAVADLLGDAVLAAAFEGGHYATLYLSPRDYHRFHTPTAGRITRVDYWPGALWPVNAIGLQGVDGLFAKNERICAYLQPEQATQTSGPGIALVAVGATMVGSVRLTFTDLTTNVAAAPAVQHVYLQRTAVGASQSAAAGSSEGGAGAASGGEAADMAAPEFARGEEWGHFEFGSTIVMLLPPGEFEISSEPVGTPLRLGMKIGRRLALGGPDED